MSMTENELSGLRYLIRAANTHRTVTPSDVARYLGISTASTTALLDRLERDGYVTRKPHPSDRRKLHVLATVHADAEIRATLGDMHERMMDAARGFHPAESDAIAEFLRRITAAVEGIAEDAPAATDRARS
jgi:DNA-binding MarR family transcriptional regulator